MQIGSTLTIPAEPSLVFERFLDPKTMRACIPGCVELERLDDAHHRGLLVNEIAHARFSGSFAAKATEIEAPRLVRAATAAEASRRPRRAPRLRGLLADALELLARWLR